MNECKINNIVDIVKDYLEKNNYSGLFNSYIQCGCGLDDFMPCDEFDIKECIPAYKVTADCKNCENTCDGYNETDYCFTIIKK